MHLGSWRRVPEEGNRSLTLPRDRAAARGLRACAWASRTWSCCPSSSTRSTGRGATRRRATSRRPAATGRRRTSCSSSTRCTSAASASSSTGCPSHFPTDEHGLALLRRHAPLRARRSAPGPPPGLGQLHLQLRAERGAELPPLQRDVLARRLPRDGLRVDAVASMLYLDYSRKARRVDPERVRRPREPRGDRVPPARSTRSSTREYPDVQTIAEESTAWPMVSRPTLRRRARLRDEVGHGLDARHARVLRRTIPSTASTTTTS